ncbi:MAG TPA: hypothetical protein VMS09_12110 [Paenibacillus sp.]|nr:hypothetical protein [Paenibacillus sp.]HUC92760.1 hypothetical protein [Paenibacillus sp.]
MRKALFTALGMGAAYLMRNKSARQRLMSQIQSFAGRNRTPR